MVLKHYKFDDELICNLQSFVKKLNDECSNGALVVVEGQKDVMALTSLGFRGDVFTVCQNGRLVELTEVAEKYRKTILLLDFDAKGRALTKKIATLLSEKRRVVDLFFRRMLLSTTKGRVRKVEELINFREYFELHPKFE
ncbi:MAG: toprim domain-containing protein [Nitrososphaerales archaeon]|nr:toprim domain-containing protein [Nitrososphaerales archaeon]